MEVDFTNDIWKLYLQLVHSNFSYKNKRVLKRTVAQKNYIAELIKSSYSIQNLPFQMRIIWRNMDRHNNSARIKQTYQSRILLRRNDKVSTNPLGIGLKINKASSYNWRITLELSTKIL